MQDNTKIPTKFQDHGSIPITKIPGLPINEKWDEIKEKISKNQVVIVCGETGSGKTTQLPKICLELGRGQRKKIVCTQPRRIAAISVARRVAEELGEGYANLVGFKIRFQDKTSPFTKIKFVTDGILLSEVKKSHLLWEYDTIIVDEAHERSLNIDCILGIIKRILPLRRDLRVIISSATIDTRFFSDFFDNAPVINVSGRGYPVDIIYEDFEGDGFRDFSLVDKTVYQIEKIHKQDPFGDILVFLPTERDIIDVYKELKSLENAKILPIFSRLSQREQQKIFIKTNRQKIVLATNIAETSITVPGIKYVVDSGLARISHYNWRTGIKSLSVTSISKASANQRAGRAGRVCPGKCYRLYSIEDFEKRDEWTKPEILRSNLAEVILKIIDLNICKIEEFPFLTPPSEQLIKEGINTLKEIGAIDENENLTDIGKILCELPIDPRLGRMIIQAKKENALKEIIIIASALSIQDPRERPIGRENASENTQKRFRDERSDFITLLNIWREFDEFFRRGTSRKMLMKFCEDNFLSYNRMMEWRDIQNQILQIIKEKKWHINKDDAPYDAIHRSILSGFLSFIAVHQEEIKYKGAKGKEICIFPGSSLYKKRPKWIVSTDITRTTRLYARLCAEIEPQWIVELAHNYKKSVYYNPHYEKKRGEVVAFEKILVFGLTVSDGNKRSFSKIDPQESRRIFINDGIIPFEIGNHFKFIEHNRKIIEEITDIENRLRNKTLSIDNNILYEFYSNALKILEDKSNISYITNIRDLDRAIKLVGDECLRLDREKILEMVDESVFSLYPGSINIKNYNLNLIYRFSPGTQEDGITVQIPHNILREMDEEPFKWLVPGYFEEKINFMLKKLPSEVKKKLPPLNQIAEDIAKKIFNREKILSEELVKILNKDFSLNLSEDYFLSIKDLPPHLIMKYEILDNKGKVIDKGVNIDALKQKWTVGANIINENNPEWQNFKKRWERDNINPSTIPDYPERLLFFDENHNINLEVYPYLISTNKPDVFSIKLTFDRDYALNKTNETVSNWIKLNIKKEIEFIKSKINISSFPSQLFYNFNGIENYKNNIINFCLLNLMEKFTRIPDKEILTETLNKIRKNIVSYSLSVLEKLNLIINQYNLILEEIKKIETYHSYFKADNSQNNIISILKKELQGYVGETFPDGMTINELSELPRYLKALHIRAARAYADPKKDKLKWEQIKPYIQVLEELKSHGKINGNIRPYIENLQKMIEEYKISVFAPEIKVSMPVSPKKIEEYISRIPKKI